MNFKIGTASQWFLVLCGVFAYGFWLNIPAARDYAALGAGCFGLWLGMVSSRPGEDGKHDWILICLTVLLSVAAGWFGARIWRLGPDASFRPDNPWQFSSFHPLIGTKLLWLSCALTGWFTGFTAAMVQKGWRQTLGFGATLGVVAVVILPWSAPAICALTGVGDEDNWTRAFFILSILLIVLLDVVLLTLAGFRREPRNRRAWLTLGIAALLALGLWGATEGCYQWEVRRLRRECPDRPVVLTPSEQRALTLFHQFNDATKAYFESQKSSDTPSPDQLPGGMGVSTQQFVQPPNMGSCKWLPVRFPDNTFQKQEQATKEYIARALAADASPECAEMFASLEQLLHEEHLIFPSTANMTLSTPLARLRVLEQWLVGRAQLRHYTGDTAGTVHYLNLSLRMGEVWPGDPTLIGQLVRIAIDQIALNAIVSLGPDGPEYIDFYRDCLRRGLARHYDQISELDYLATFWDSALAGQLLWTRTGQIPPTLYSWFRNPLTLRLLVQQYRAGEQAQTQFPAVRQQVATGVPLAATPAQDFIEIHQKLARATLIAEAKLQTGLALKLYRSLHGEYPETLQRLVPELLPVLPNDPETGKPLSYRKVENYFELSDSVRRTPLRPIADY